MNRKEKVKVSLGTVQTLTLTFSGARETRQERQAEIELHRSTETVLT